MRNKDCKVVQDLLPNYIEKLTSEETNKFIEEHLQECPECKAMLESMKAEIKINTAKQDDREVEYIKKFNVKFKKVEYKLFVLIYTILVIIMVGTLGFFGRKYIILKNLSNKWEQYTKMDNYYMKMVDHSIGGSTINEYWIKDNNLRSCTSANGIKYWQYILKDGKFYLYFQDELRDERAAEENEYNDMAFFPSTIKMLQEKFNDHKAIFTNSIETLKFNGKVCYKIKENDSLSSYIYFEKDTGLPVKTEYWEIGEQAGATNLRSNVRSYEFKFDCVKDRHIEFDDGTEYEFKEVTKTAKLGENANIIDGNLNIEISNLAYDEAKDEFITDIKFSTIDGKGIDTDFKYEYIIYDADSKIVASSIAVAMTPEKDRIASKFSKKHYAGELRGDFISNMIGVAEQKENTTDIDKIHHTIIVSELREKLNLENLNALITNIKYKNKGEPETIEPEIDYIFTFN